MRAVLNANGMIGCFITWRQREICTLACLLIGGFSNNAVAMQQIKRGANHYEVECASCHGKLSEDKSRDGQRAWIGPDLCRAKGQKGGSEPGYSYSKAMKTSTVTWNEGFLVAFILDPQRVVPGNRMPYSGVLSVSTAADIAKYLTVTTCQPRDKIDAPTGK